MRKLLGTVFACVLCGTFVFAGDAAAFVDLGFSTDNQTYVFGQYGKTDKSFQAYAEIYTVDMKKNDFVSNGVFKNTGSNAVTGKELFSELVSRNKSFLSAYTLHPVRPESVLYIREDDSKNPAEEIVFKDFSNPAASVFYHVRLVPLYEGTGSKTKSSFYIVAEKKQENGTLLARFVAGNPDIKRDGVTGYTIDQIFAAPDGSGIVFVVEKTVADSTGISIRYMVETVVF